jgi:hypothetical protein
MRTMRLDPGQLSVESFEAAQAQLPVAEMILRTPACSAIDACPTRLCETSTC